MAVTGSEAVQRGMKAEVDGRSEAFSVSCVSGCSFQIYNPVYDDRSDFTHGVVSTGLYPQRFQASDFFMYYSRA